ncbi:MAG: hypothetical protein Q9160_008569 [Pyrenula sp. 1 TL-2023]
MPFSTLPPSANASASTITPFTLSTPQSSLDELKTLLNVSKVAPQTYENSFAKKEESYGVTREWMLGALGEWRGGYDWRETERYINSFPNFMAKIRDGEGEENAFDVHFVALFSEREDAVPVVMTHGWPGSFLEFLPLLSNLKSQYTPATLPYHIVIPSIPGYTLSSGPPKDRDYNLEDVARLWNKLMIALGFGDKGYVTQGGDLGSGVSQILGQKFEECKAVHVNVIFSPPPDPAPKVSAAEEAMLAGNGDFWTRHIAYAQMHATRPATIGIGEKFLTWTDEDPPLRAILDSVTLYWLTETIARCTYPYRALINRPATTSPQPFLAKPLGFSSFPKEVTYYPKSWAEKFGQLEFYREHTSGGHFAALEKPKELWQDVDEFVKKVWKA